MKRKEFEASKAIFVLLLTAVIFAIGIFIGTQLSSQKVVTVLDLGQKLQIQTLGVEVQHEILEANICENDILYLTEDLAEIAERLEFMENNLGPDDSQVAVLKEYYFVLQAKHWLLAKQRVEECFNEAVDLNSTTILYFYSNANDCPDCQEQGYALNYLRRIYDGMKVYSFDTNLDTPITTVFKNIYNISTETPALVINEQTNIGFLDIEEIEQFIEQQQIVVNETNTTHNQS